MSEFTPGKWIVKELLTTWGVFAMSEGKCEPVADCLEKADARLIAAAPEMYRMLREELIPTSDYGGMLSFSRESKVHKLLACIDGEEAQS